MPKRRKKNRTGGIWPPVSPLAPPETQRVGQGIAGLFSALDLFWSGISGKNKDAWYDRLLHVYRRIVNSRSSCRGRDHAFSGALEALAKTNSDRLILRFTCGAVPSLACVA